MKLPSRVLVLSMAATLLMGCEGDWTSGGGVDSWSDAYNWVNFSGVYRGVGGGVLVTDYSTTPGASSVTYSVSSELIKTANGDSAYSGVLMNHPIDKKSLTIRVGSGGFVLQDVEGSGTLTGNSGSDGAIDTGTGSWSIDLKVPVASGTKITADYTYTVSGAGGSGGAGPGTSGITIYSFSVQQQGQNISVVDNNGRTYEGNFGSIRSTGGSDQDNQSTPAVGDSVIGQFEVSGVSAAGFKVKMVGTLQGVVGSGGSGTGFFLAERKMFGTWIEDGGQTGDINGESSPLAISVTTTTP